MSSDASLQLVQQLRPLNPDRETTVDANLLEFSNMTSCSLSALSGVWVELSLSYGRRPVDQFVLVSGSSLVPITRFYPYPFFSDNYFVVLPVGRPLWREDGSVTYSAIADWSGHCGPITLYYRLIWDCVPSSSPLTTRRDYGGGILTGLHTEFIRNVQVWAFRKHTKKSSSEWSWFLMFPLVVRC
jgi:hypothetical protein